MEERVFHLLLYKKWRILHTHTRARTNLLWSVTGQTEPKGRLLRQGVCLTVVIMKEIPSADEEMCVFLTHLLIMKCQRYIATGMTNPFSVSRDQRDVVT